MTFTPSEEFTTIAVEVKATPIAVSDTTRLKLYGLYKQTTMGDTSESAPWMAMNKETAMLKAWVQQKGTSQADAQAQYIAAAKLVLGRK